MWRLGRIGFEVLGVVGSTEENVSIQILEWGASTAPLKARREML